MVFSETQLAFLFLKFLSEQFEKTKAVSFLYVKVILSCTHVFHRQCLKSFERFCRGTRVCPICRHNDYEKLNTCAGNEETYNRCATLIQKIFRGHRARKRCQVKPEFTSV